MIKNPSSTFATKYRSQNATRGLKKVDEEIKCGQQRIEKNALQILTFSSVDRADPQKTKCLLSSDKTIGDFDGLGALHAG